ncbi:HAD family phosphatase [Synechococcus moorigangaii CMS01]|nr:HAD family phosphatase [Synechococcus moorigangaii CMS01]
MQDIRLLVLDIDGTILGKSLDVSPAVLTAIEAVQRRGIRVAIATGRMFCSAKKYHQLIASDVPLIAYNGAWIQDPLAPKPQRQLSVPGAIAKDIIEYLATEPWQSKLHLHVYHGDQLYVKELNERVFAYQERTGCQAKLMADLQDILQYELTKILAVCHHEDLPAKLLPAVKSRYTQQQIHCVQSTEFYVEFTSPVATKGQALKILTEDILGLTAQNVMAIGDNYNDLEMIQYAGLGVAMGNAPVAVQAVADHVTSSIEKDGVAAAIAKFLL